MGCSGVSHWWLLLLLLLSAPLRADEAEDFVLRGTVAKVTDGDSLRVRLTGGPADGRRNEVEVRLHGADAPEFRQPGGREAGAWLRERLLHQTVEIRVVAQDRHNRLVGVVYAGDENLSATLVDRGLAWAYRQYLAEVPGAPELCRLEAEARAAGRGLWGAEADTWTPPWLYRKLQNGAGRDLQARSYAAETEADCRAAIPRRRRADDPNDKRCLIKGNISSNGDRIYHVPGSTWYEKTRIDTRKGERWFCSEEEARDAGWRAPRG
jgi:endonuclease YncB( thermonuclease family)